MCGQWGGGEVPALGPSPVAMTLLRRSARHEDAAVELQELDVLEVAGWISAIGRKQPVAHPDVPFCEQRSDERRARPVHARHDQSKGRPHRSDLGLGLTERWTI